MIKVSTALQISFLALVMGGIGAMIFSGLTTIVSAHGGDESLVHACVRQPSRNILIPNVRIVGANDGCLRGETPLDWPLTGGGGAATGYEVVMESTNVSGGGQGALASIRADCPDGKQVLGGGATSNGSHWVLQGSSPALLQSGLFQRWSAGFVNIDGDNTATNIIAYAICAAVTP